MKALIVDDVSIMRMIIKKILINYCEFDDKNIVEDNSGHSAVRLYPAINPDIVFLDINMPDFDGIMTIKEIMKIDPKAKIIMCTSSADKYDISQCVAAGAVGYILKPPHPEKVKEMVQNIMNVSFGE